MKVMIVKEVMTGDVSPVAMFSYIVIIAKYKKHCQRHNGPRELTPYLE